MTAAGGFQIVIVAHAETVWWDDGTRALEVAVGAWLDLQARLATRLGRPVRSTLCPLVDHPTPEKAVVEAGAAPGLWRRVLAEGNEVGLHVHAPTDRLKDGLQDRLVADDAGRHVAAGLPRPRCYAAGDWVVEPDLARTLEEAGFTVDVSVQTLFGPMDRFGARVAHRRPHLRPYRPSRTAIDREGDSGILEIPPSGELTELADRPIGGLPPVRDRIRTRREAGEPDVFQLVWHPYELVTLDGMDDEALRACNALDDRPDPTTSKIDPHASRLAAIGEALVEIGEDPAVEFVTASEAARRWQGLEAGH
jgi:hypothetical protein